MVSIDKNEINDLSKKVIGAAIEVHKNLGPGLLENAYEECLCKELSLQGIPFEKQKYMPVNYKGCEVDCGYRLDIVVDNKIIVELKSTASITPIHEAQLMTYLKLSNIWLGLLLNFNVISLKNGIKRVVCGFLDSE